MQLILRYWSGVPSRMVQLLHFRYPDRVRWAQLGPNGSFFFIYGDGTYYWEGVDEDLDEILRKNEHSKLISRVFLSPSEIDAYFVEYICDKKPIWKAMTSFHNAMNKNSTNPGDDMSAYSDEESNDDMSTYSDDEIANMSDCGSSSDSYY